MTAVKGGPQVGVLSGVLRARKSGSFLGPLGFDFAQHMQTLRPTVDGIRSKALRPFGSQ